MSDSIIVYGSKYGSTRRYAEELGKMTDWDIVDYCHVKHLNSCRKIVYLGALFAGGVLGLKKTLAKVTDFEGNRIAVITVGLTTLVTRPTWNASVRKSESRWQRKCLPGSPSFIFVEVSTAQS